MFINVRFSFFLNSVAHKIKTKIIILLTCYYFYSASSQQTHTHTHIRRHLNFLSTYKVSKKKEFLNDHETKLFVFSLIIRDMSLYVIILLLLFLCLLFMSIFRDNNNDDENKKKNIYKNTIESVYHKNTYTHTHRINPPNTHKTNRNSSNNKIHR